MTTLERLLIAVIAVALALGAATWFGYSLGWNARQVKVNTDELAALREREGKAKEGHTVAEQYESKLIELETLYEKQGVQLRTALRRKVVCPASGELGDVVLPADVIRGMFPSAHSAPVPAAASEPDGSMH